MRSAVSREQRKRRSKREKPRSTESWADLYEDEHLGSDHIEGDQPVVPRLPPRTLTDEERDAFQQLPDDDDELCQLSLRVRDWSRPKWFKSST